MYCYNLLCDIRLTSRDNSLFTHRRFNPGGLHRWVHSSFLYPLFSCIVFDKLIRYHPGSHLSTQMVLYSSLTALQVVRWVACYSISSNILSLARFPPRDLFRYTASNLDHPARFESKRRARNSSIGLQRLIAVTGTVCTMGTHALRILRRVVDLTGRSHAQWRGHGWSHVTHWVKHGRPKS